MSFNDCFTYDFLKNCEITKENAKAYYLACNGNVNFCRFNIVELSIPNVDLKKGVSEEEAVKTILEVINKYAF